MSLSSGQAFNPEVIIAALIDKGYAVIDCAIPGALAECRQALQQVSDGDLRRAGVGRGQAQTLDEVRRDKIHWLANAEHSIPLYAQAMEALRQAANQAFYLGLFDFECHFARYDAGDFYQKHWDAFRGEGNRRLSTIYYLNDAWQTRDGGELLVYDQDNADSVIETVVPMGGAPGGIF
ncbi:2OG-Fe(II) oxygenase [Halioxenophilus aromaticivorans]|uniref:2OG-Fe(II) oxygenase n=1 Tax=Halioxenophilus aromaticivorans TaxID=1306992 RepID=A0AAV3TZW4_9ALTE